MTSVTVSGFCLRTLAAIETGYNKPDMNERLHHIPPEFARKPETGIETAREKAGLIAEQMKDVVREYGLEALKEMLAKMQTAVDEGRGVQAVELAEVIETRPERSEFQKLGLENLELLGFIEHSAEGTMIVDADKLFNELQLNVFSKKTKTHIPGMEVFGRNRAEFFANVFADQEVVLKAQFEQDPEAQPKPLFYLPETRDEALDIEAIKQSDFHYGLWQIPAGTKGPKLEAAEMPQPVSLTESSFLETSLAAIVYHPRFGNGVRDENGQLKITKDGREIAVTGQWLYDQGLKFVVDGVPGGIRTDARKVIRQYAPNIVERQLLTPEDFAREQHSNRANETVRVSSNGFVSLDGVKHYLGRQFVDRKIRVDRIDNKHAAIVELDDEQLGRPVAIIKTFAKHAPGLAERKTNTSSFFEAGGKLTQPRVYNEAEFTTPQEGESEEQLLERQEALAAFKAVLDFDNELKKQTDLKVFDLPENLRHALRHNGDKLRANEQLNLEFAKVFGQTGLEIVAAMAENPALAAQLIKTSLELPSTEQAALLPKLQDAIMARLEALQTLDNHRELGLLNDLDYRKILFEINRRVISLLTAAEDSAAIQDSLTSTNKQVALEKLSEEGTELVLFANIFRDAFKGTANMDFEQLRGLSVDTEHGGRIDQQTKEQMLAIFEDNWRGQKPEALPALRQGFLQKLEHGEQTQFHILKKDGRVVAFIRFDERPDLEPGALYGGSLNVGPSLRGSAIGEAMMKSAVDEAAKEHVIYADVFPELIVGTKYVEDLGCVITGVEEISLGGKTVKRLLLKRNDQENANYKRAGKNAQTITLDIGRGVEDMLKVIEQQTKSGQVATRYFADPANPNLRTLVFEPRAEEPDEMRLPPLPPKFSTDTRTGLGA